MKSKAYFQNKHGYMDFDNNHGTPDSGVLSCGAYSYEIDSYGNYELTKEETKQLFLSMYYYFKAYDADFFKRITEE